MRTFLVLCLSVALAACSITQKQTPSTVKWGKFNDTVKTEWLPGRQMKLLNTVTYVDPKGRKWEAPAGAIIDGASIPRAFWTVVGGPYEGPYRDASVIHDVACDNQTERWQDVHYAFYTAMLAKGVPEDTAKVMYAAVYRFGPRWNMLKQKLTIRTPNTTDVKKIENFVEKEEPTIHKLETTEEIPGAPSNEPKSSQNLHSDPRVD